MTSWVRDHPDAVRNLGALAAGVGAFATVVGALAIGAGIAGLLGGGVIIVGLVALTGALAALAAMNWKVITDGLESWRISDWNKIISDALAKVIDAFKDWIKNLASSIVSALQGMWANMKNELGGLFGGGGGGNDGSAALSAGDKALYGGLIRKYGGDQVDNLLKIYGTEGASSYVGDHGSSFGPFQLHYGGLAGGADSHPGMGEIFTRETGLDARDPTTVADQVKWMVGWGRKRGYSSSIWHGLRDKGIGSLGGGHDHPRPGMDKTSMNGDIHVAVHLDGEVVHRSVMKRAATQSQFAKSAPYWDGSRSWIGPDANIVTT